MNLKTNATVKGSSPFHKFKTLDLNRIEVSVTKYNTPFWNETHGFAINIYIIAKSPRMKRYHRCVSTGLNEISSLYGDSLSFFHIDEPEKLFKIPLVIKNQYKELDIGDPFTNKEVKPEIIKELREIFHKEVK